LFYGLGTWNINYLYVWPILAVAACLLREMKHPLAWAVLSGVFGLMFGALCAPVDVFIGGWGYAVSKWVSGIPFDLAHCVGNFVIALLLFVPLRTLVEKLYKRIER
jgi:energy-coupling factor transport system substrate-specific component